jgi:hypothetical protein
METLIKLTKLSDAPLQWADSSRKSVKVVFATFDLSYDGGDQSRRIDRNQLCLRMLTLRASPTCWALDDAVHRINSGVGCDFVQEGRLWS